MVYRAEELEVRLTRWEKSKGRESMGQSSVHLHWELTHPETGEIKEGWSTLWIDVRLLDEAAFEAKFGKPIEEHLQGAARASAAELLNKGKWPVEDPLGLELVDWKKNRGKPHPDSSSITLTIRAIRGARERLYERTIPVSDAILEDAQIDTREVLEGYVSFLVDVWDEEGVLSDG